MGDRDFRGVLAGAPAEETHLYFEVFWATLTGLSFRAIFLAGVLLLTEGLPLATPAFKTDAGATALLAMEGMAWLFTQVNLDFFRKDVLIWVWLFWDEGLRESGFTTLDRADKAGVEFTAVATAGVAVLMVCLVAVVVLLVRDGWTCTFEVLCKLVEVFTVADFGTSEE